MVCESISSIECSVLLASQQDVKLMFILLYLAAFIFIWYYFTPKRIDKIKVQYYAWPVLTAKWSGFMYFLFSPVTVLLFASDVSYEIVMGWFAIFYFPTMIVAFLMPILMVFDYLFRLLGYKDTFDFAKKYRKQVI